MSNLRTPFEDRKHRRIYCGDLIRSPHFKDGRGKQYWLYHVAVERDGHYYAVPTSHADPRLVKEGGDALLNLLAQVGEIIHEGIYRE